MTWKLRDGVSTADTDYGIALLDEDSGEYWNLNPTGALVLRTLLEGGTSTDAVQALVERYDVDVDVGEPGRPGPAGRPPLGRPGRPVMRTGTVLRRLRPPRRTS